MRVVVRAPDVAVVIAAARPLPAEWAAWRDARLDGTPLAPPVEAHTVPDGWSVTIVEVACDVGTRVHAFYALLDRAVHAWAYVPAGASAAARARVHAALLEVDVAWPDELAALGQL